MARRFLTPVWDLPACTRCAGCGQALELTWTNSCEGHKIYHSICHYRKEKPVTEQTWPTAPTDPTVIALPEEPAGPVWDKDGDRWEKRGDRWHWEGSGFLKWKDFLAEYGPLSTVPPARTWAVGDTVNTAEEADTLPHNTVLKQPTGDEVWQWESYLCTFYGTMSDEGKEFEDLTHPLTILWLPKEQA